MTTEVKCAHCKQAIERRGLHWENAETKFAVCPKQKDYQEHEPVKD